MVLLIGTPIFFKLQKTETEKEKSILKQVKREYLRDDYTNVVIHRKPLMRQPKALYLEFSMAAKISKEIKEKQSKRT